MPLVAIMQAAVGAITLFFSFVFFKDLSKNKDKISDASIPKLSAIGATTLFGDTLGIGSYAPQTALWKLLNLVPDRLIPGTLNAASNIPCAIETLVFITVIKVDPITLVALIAASTIGAIFGAGFVSKLPEEKIEIGMGIALILVALTIIAGLMGLMPVGGEAIGLTGGKLLIGIVINFILGALMTIGVGCYAPMMAMVYALGMSPRVSFPIMMGSCQFLMIAAGVKFIKEGAYDRKASLVNNISGILGVLVAIYIVKEIPLTALKVLVVCVILYTSVVLIRSGLKHMKKDEIDTASM